MGKYNINYQKIKRIVVMIVLLGTIITLVAFHSRGDMDNIYAIDCPVFVGTDGFLITSPYGYRVNPITNVGEGHKGIDITRWTGYSNIATICAFADGEVIDMKNTVPWKDTTNPYNSEGNYIVIKHKSGFVTKYFHLTKDSMYVKIGDKVKEGQKIAEMGTTGNSTGYHLHFQIEHNDIPLDPLPFLLGQIVIEGQKEYKPWRNQASKWFVDDVEWAVEKGIIKGDENGNYGLQDKVTKEQVAAMIRRALESENQE